MNRRKYLTVLGAGAVGATAGCLSLLPTNADEKLDGVEPNADQLPRPTLGDGPVTIDVYEDMGCPACHTFIDEMFPTIEEELIETGRVTYHHYDFPAGANERTVPIANAARAVQDDTHTDDDPAGAFFEYKAQVFVTETWDDSTLTSIADDHGADPEFVQEALDEERYYPQLLADFEHGENRDVHATPTVFVEGAHVDHSDFNDILSHVEDAE